MPGLSGMGLLSKIMSHKRCKTVPVISEHLFSKAYLFAGKLFPFSSSNFLDYLDI
jgi:hypothetical protein